MNNKYDLSLCVEQDDGRLLCLLKTGKYIFFDWKDATTAEADPKALEALNSILLKKAGVTK